MDSQTGDKQKQGGAAKDKDTIRASILDEAVIVCGLGLFSDYTFETLVQLKLIVESNLC